MTDEPTNIATAAAFSGDWESAADVIADFQIAPDALADARIIAAHYVFEDYVGSAFVLFEKDGNLYEVHGSHCSCYGLEGQWDPEIETPESLIHRAKASIGRAPMYDAAEKVLAYLTSGDPHAALSQHLHGDGDTPTAGGRLIASAAEAAVDAWRTRALAAETEVERLRAATPERDGEVRRMALEEAFAAINEYPRAAPSEDEWTRYDEQIEHSQGIIRALIDAPPQAAPACTTPGCANRPVIRLDDRHLCRGCYATHDFGDDA